MTKKIIKKQNNNRKQASACTLAKKQVDKWFASISSKRNYRDTALEIGLPIDGSIL